MTKLVTTADAGHVRTITLNRAEKKNALNLGFTTKTYPLAGSARCVQ